MKWNEMRATFDIDPICNRVWRIHTTIKKNRASQANNRTKEIRESKQINAMLCSVQCNENKQTNQKRKKKLKKLLYEKQTTAQNKYDAIYKVSSPFHIKRLQCADGLWWVYNIYKFRVSTILHPLSVWRSISTPANIMWIYHVNAGAQARILLCSHRVEMWVSFRFWLESSTK